MARRSIFTCAMIWILAQTVLFDSQATTTLACPPESYFFRPLWASNGYLLLCYVALTMIWFYSLAIMIERTYTYSSVARKSRRFIHRASLALSAGQPDKAMDVSERFKGSPIARAMQDVLQTRLSSGGPKLDDYQFFASAYEYVVDESRESLNRGVFLLKRLAFISLALGGVGTWLGLQEANARTEYMNQQLSMDQWAYWADDFDRLVSGAYDIFTFSLIIAVPALLAYRSYSSKARQLSGSIDSSCWELLNRLLKREARQPMSAIQTTGDYRAVGEESFTGSAGQVCSDCGNDQLLVAARPA